MIPNLQRRELQIPCVLKWLRRRRLSSRSLCISARDAPEFESSPPTLFKLVLRPHTPVS